MIEHIFLVGCPRSGTTLLQSMLAAHPQVMSFPETHLFRSVIPNQLIAARWGIASRRAYSRLAAYLDAIDRADMRTRLPKRSLLARQYISAFVGILDELTLEKGRRIWVEKTPKHVQYVDQIVATVERPRFLHILRDGRDVVASLYQVTHEYPEEWSGERSIDQCIERWRHDVAISLAYRNDPNHLLVSYEQLIAEPAASLDQICRFMGIDFEHEMVSCFSRAAGDLVLGSEAWKSDNLGGLSTRNTSKLTTVFTPDQQAYIRVRIAEIADTLQGWGPEPHI